MPTFLNRYLKGEYEQVWRELNAEGDAIQYEPLYHDALAVAQETMRRVRKNVELIVGRLDALGYVFGIYPDGHTKIAGYTSPYRPSRRDIAKEITKLEQLDGIDKIPLSLKAFWQFVGEVNLMGCHSLWPPYSDPLVLYSIEVAKSEYEDWRFAVETDHEIELFGIPLAPDYFHKDNVSGGAPYTILVPNATIDGSFENERNETTLVNYLRICFRYGGFPGIQWYNGVVPKEMSGLSEDLLPI